MPFGFLLCAFFSHGQRIVIDETLERTVL